MLGILNDSAAAAITPTNMNEATTLPCTGLLMALGCTRSCNCRSASKVREIKALQPMRWGRRWAEQEEEEEQEQEQKEEEQEQEEEQQQQQQP